MRIAHIVFAGCGIAAGLLAGSDMIEAQLNRRPAGARAPIAAKPLQRQGMTGNPMIRKPAEGGPVTPAPDLPEPGPPEHSVPPAPRIVVLVPDIPPANGPAGAHGVATLNRTRAGMLAETGMIAISGLPSGRYDVWVVFNNPLIGQAVFSQLVARVIVAEDNEHADATTIFGMLAGRELGGLKQIVMTSTGNLGVEVGGEPVAGAAGQIGGPSEGAAYLAANVHEPGPDVSEPQRAAPPRSSTERRMLPAQRSRIRAVR